LDAGVAEEVTELLATADDVGPKAFFEVEHEG
jgi:hypothetical protein